MADNVPKNAQITAADTGSDTEPINGLASYMDSMGIDGSSSPAPSGATSSVGGPAESASSDDDTNDVTIIKIEEPIAAKDGDDESKAPFFDKHGNACDENTPFTEFHNWNQYLGFCHQGPKLTVRLAVRNEDGDDIGYAKVAYPAKILSDFGEYFKGLQRSNMIEKSLGFVNLDDVDYEDFRRLIRVIEAGGPCARLNLGPSFRTLSIYLEIYILADRFMMPMIKAWATACMEDYLRENLAWAAAYQQQVVDQHAAVGTSPDQIHQEMLLDFNDAWVRSEFLPDDNRPVQQARYLQYVLNYCPRVLLRDMVHELHPKFVGNVCIALLNL